MGFVIPLHGMGLQGSAVMWLEMSAKGAATFTVQTNTSYVLDGGSHGEAAHLIPGPMDHLIHLLDRQDILWVFL